MISSRLLNRVARLEKDSNAITLSDGTKFFPSGSGIELISTGMRLARVLGRDPELSDFSQEDQEQLRAYAKWYPNGDQGALSAMVTDMARKMVGGELGAD
jgi:hypothetical protein